MIVVRRTWMISGLLAMLTDARLMIVVSLLIITVVRCRKSVAFPLKTCPPKSLASQMEMGTMELRGVLVYLRL